MPGFMPVSLQNILYCWQSGLPEVIDQRDSPLPQVSARGLIFLMKGEINEDP